jgi:predicted Ser/Thr protein kinase
MEQFRDRVKEVATIVTAVREGATVTMINGKQCGSLASVYDGIDDYLKNLVEMDAANDVCLLPLLDEIIRVLERGKVLVLQYGSAQWFELAVTRGDNREAFKEIHLLLETNMKTLQNHISPDLYWPTNLWNYISEAKLEMMGIAKDDHDKILETLEMFYENLPTAIAKLKGTPQKYNLPINMQIDWREVKHGKIIGKGAYGLVREACWLGCKFAIKIIKTEDIDALRKEVGILAKLSHPHIVQLVGFSRGYTTSMILMELMDGDLHHLIKDRVKSTPQTPPFPPEVAMDIISQIAAGMAYLHKQGVLHGDLKASNVLVKHRGGHIEAKIADFGVSQTVQLTKRSETSKRNYGDIGSGSSVYSNSSFSGIVGTTGWRAPEVSHIQVSI